MTKKALFTLVLTLLMSALLVLPVMAKTGAKIDRLSSTQAGLVDRFSVGSQNDYQSRGNPVLNDMAPRQGGAMASRRSLGAAASPSNGPGIGFVYDNTFEDTQMLFELGYHVKHSVNGSDVDVHFAYEDVDDSSANARPKQSGYQVYNATGTPAWPNGLEIGCAAGHS